MKNITILFLFCASLYAQTNYTDDFSAQPFSGNPTSFTTGTASVGLFYEGSNCDFGWTGSAVNALAPLGEYGYFKITARDGKAFKFNSIYIQYSSGGGINIIGSGFESFNIFVPSGASGATYSPAGGSKIVTQVIVESVAPHDFFPDFDDVSTQVGYSIHTFIDGSTFEQSITSNTTNQVLGRFNLDADYSGSSLNGAVIQLIGTPTGISNFKLWSSSDASFGGDAQLGSTVANYPGNGNTVSFSGFTSNISTSGTYYFLTADMAENPTGTVAGYIQSNASLTIQAGAINGTINNAALSNGTSPLPVELVNLNAISMKNKVLINWQTATEINNYGFEVERTRLRPDNRDYAVAGWEKIGFVEGCGNSNSVKEYSFVDKEISEGIYYYRLKQIDIDGSFSYSNEVVVKAEAEEMPAKFEMFQNYPNPFNPVTMFDYSIPEKTEVIIKIYNGIGREIKTVVSEIKESGRHTVEFDGSWLPSGVYFYRMQAGSFTDTKKFIILK